MRMDALSNALDDSRSAKAFARNIIYTIPTVQNPTATILPLRTALSRCCGSARSMAFLFSKTIAMRT
jgi:hypothetical protein